MNIKRPNRNRQINRQVKTEKQKQIQKNFLEALLITDLLLEEAGYTVESLNIWLDELMTGCKTIKLIPG